MIVIVSGGIQVSRAAVSVSMGPAIFLTILVTIQSTPVASMSGVLFA